MKQAFNLSKPNLKQNDLKHSKFGGFKRLKLKAIIKDSNGFEPVTGSHSGYIRLIIIALLLTCLAIL